MSTNLQLMETWSTSGEQVKEDGGGKHHNGGEGLENTNGPKGGKKRQKWPISRSLTQNKPGLKKFHDLTLFHGARPHGAVVLLHGALPLGAMVFSSVAA
jgi:hypothetical protein